MKVKYVYTEEPQCGCSLAEVGKDEGQSTPF